METRALGGSLDSEPTPTTRAQMGDWLLQLRIDKKLRDESKSNKTQNCPGGTRERMWTW